jgi:transposase
MIALPVGVQVWLATGWVPPSFALVVQESLKRDPRAGDLYAFRGRGGDLIKVIWHDGQGSSRMERSRIDAGIKENNPIESILRL